jgi:predicted N-acetyltransferase YhbS
MPRLVSEAPGHVPARELLLDRCFGPDRHRKTSEMLRRGRRPAAGLAFAMLDGRRLIGTLRLWHITAGTAGPALLLGPIAVEPKWQSEGWGARLMRHGLAEAERLGHAAVLLVGDAPYYGRFGFTRELTQHLVLPGPVERERFLGLELVPGALEDAHGAVVPGARVVARRSSEDDGRPTQAGGRARQTVRSLRRLTPQPSTSLSERASAQRR